MSPAAAVAARRALVLGLAAYGVVSLRTPGTYRFLDALDLAIHETGHLLFTPLGETMHFLGGTLFQLALPLLFVLHFARRGDRFAAWVACWWVAQNLWNISVYIGDARARRLPLVGGGEHDWTYLLSRVGWLGHDLTIARMVHASGVALFAWAMLQAWRHASPGEVAPAPGEVAPAPGEVAPAPARADHAPGTSLTSAER